MIVYDCGTATASLPITLLTHNAPASANHCQAPDSQAVESNGRKAYAILQTKRGRKRLIHYGSIYLIVKDFDASMAFYRALLEKDADAQNMTRFAIFHLDGLCLSLLNAYFDG